jgi:outer membrane protein assembly factor BamB
MKITKNKISAIAIVIFFILSMTASMILTPTTNAHTPPWSIPTYAYIDSSPNPVGVGQSVSLVFWIDAIPPTAAGVAGDRWINLKVEVTKPDGTNETIGLFSSDPVGGSYASYTPEQPGNYTFYFSFPGQVATGSTGTGINGTTTSAFINDYYQPSNAKETITVQQEPIPGVISYPLPTEYWARPIEGQNAYWYTIGSNYLSTPQIVGRVQPSGTAPNSGHIMWTKPIMDGGVVGGTNTGQSGMTYYEGTAYEQKFTNSMIIHGRLYYDLPRSDTGTGGGYVCVNLHTGEMIYWQNMTMPSFGQLYDYESLNQHGVISNGYLWSTSGTTWIAYDPRTGNWLFNLTDVPTGTAAYGSNGEILRYVINGANKWLALWNNTAAHDLTGATIASDVTSTSFNQWRPVGKTVNASQAYSWNLTIPSMMTGATIVSVFPEDILLGRNGTLPTVSSSWAPYTMWAISLKPASKGQLLWMKTYDAPTGNLSRSIRQVDPQTRVFAMYDQQVMQYTGYSLDNGSYLWGPTPSEAPLNFYALTTGAFGVGASAVAYGNLYSTGYSGIVYCYDLKTGNLLWTYEAKAGLASPSGVYSLLMTAIADGKIYLQSYEHSANAPHWQDSKMRCINASTGEELWAVFGWGNSSPNPVADGYIVYLNAYDMQLYCFGKGPSATSVSMQNDAGGIQIMGTVIDTAAGTNQEAQAGRFPHGVPAVSDASENAWMEYVYTQKPLPTNITGVPVSLDAIDPNGNSIHIGDATSDADGYYCLLVNPNMLSAGAGIYKVIASFAGSNSYWPSHSESFFVVANSPTVAPTAIPQSNIATNADLMTYIAVGVIAIIIAIAIVGALILMAVRKRP